MTVGIESGLDLTILDVLLKDRTTNNNIIWATDDYNDLGPEYTADKEIFPHLLFQNTVQIIKPRKDKILSRQDQRTRERAEVFTPSWVCNAQNNLVDDAWFQKKSSRFNKETDKSWETNYRKVAFPKKIGKTWQDYVRANRLEVSCGEAPYLTSRYDTVTGKPIPVKMRIGLLDRKLRIINENVEEPHLWLDWAKAALKATYGFEWQGDNVLLARENIFLTTIEFFHNKYKKYFSSEISREFAEIISWNIWQMDGIKYVIPNTCHSFTDFDHSFFEVKEIRKNCPGCETGDHLKHNGIYAAIMDWDENKVVRFVDLVSGGKRNGTI